MENIIKPSKKNKGILGIVSVLLIILLLTGAGGYTLARYASQEQGNGNARVANWSFKIDKDGQATKIVNLTNTVDKNTLVNGKIAPGTSGEFSIKLDATGSDVAVDYILAFVNEKDKPSNLVFNYEGRKLKSLSELGDVKGTIGISGDRTATIKIGWTWAYQTGTNAEEKIENDVIDTRDGTSPLDYTFEIIAKGTQKS